MKILSCLILVLSSVAACGAAAPVEIDLFVAGGTLDAVRAAVQARDEGKSVFLAAPRPYLGEDRAATLMLDRLPSDDPADPLVREMFNPAYRAAGAYNVLKSKGWRAVQKFEPYENVKTEPVKGELDSVTTPLLVKRACDKALIGAGVRYLTGAQAVAEGDRSDGRVRVVVSARGGEREFVAGKFVDLRLPRAISKGRHKFSIRCVRGPKVHVEKIDFQFDVPFDGARGMEAVENFARSKVSTEGLLDVAEIVVVEEPVGRKTPARPEDPLEVVEGFDVVVAGGGTAGGPAAVAAARSGVKTLLVEYQNVLGGVATEGRIGGFGGYYDGNVTGFTTELDRETRKIGGVYFFAESEFLRRSVTAAGGEVWFGAMVAGAIVEHGRLTAVKVTMPDGTRVAVKCAAAVDATGNCDLAAAAGCATEYMDSQELSLQGAGMAGQPLGISCCNSDIGFVDDTDAEDLCAFALRSRLSLPDRVWNQSSLVDSRERRRLVGQFRITPIDLLLNRTYPDTVCISRSAFDTHGQTVHPVFFLRGTGKRGDRIRANVPYRAILPRETEGLVVAGLGISAHRDAMPVLRMKADMRNLGYAAGLAASLSAKSGVPLGKLDVKALQRKLIEIGNLPEAVLDAKDNLPLPDEAFAAAAKRLADGYGGLAEILSDPARAMPHLKRETSFEAMQVRALLGDADAAPALIKRLDGATWDEGWNFKGMSQYERSVSEMDAIVIALGNTRRADALPILQALARKLNGKSAYSHFRVLSRACASIGGPDAAAILSSLLALPGVAGHALRPDAHPTIPGYSDIAMNEERSDVLRELCVAAALYRLGDPDGSAKRSLRAYLGDPRRVYANFVRLVLGEPSPNML